MEQEYYRRLIQLEARVHRMEAMMQALLVRLGVDPAEVTPQEPPEMSAIREALLSFQYPQAGRERSLTPAVSPEEKYTHQILMRQVEMHYGVGLKEGKEAIDAMEGNLRG